MKFGWEASDIKIGRRVGNPGRQERWIIAYDPSSRSMARYAMVSLNDGMIASKDHTREQLASQLAATGEWPEEMLEPETRGRSLRGVPL